MFIEAFKIDDLLDPNNFILFNGENLIYHPDIDYSTYKNAQIAEMSSLKKKIFLSRDICRVDKEKKENILLQISSSSFKMKIRLSEEIPENLKE